MKNLEERFYNWCESVASWFEHKACKLWLGGAALYFVFGFWNWVHFMFAGFWFVMACVAYNENVKSGTDKK